MKCQNCKQDDGRPLGNPGGLPGHTHAECVATLLRRKAEKRKPVVDPTAPRTRKKKTTTERAYKYGLLSPMSDPKILDDLMIRAHRYYNALIEIERTRRLARRWIRAEAHGPAWQAAEEAAAAAWVEQQRAERTLKAMRDHEAPEDVLAEQRRVVAGYAAALKEARAASKRLAGGLTAAAEALVKEADAAVDVLAEATYRATRAAHGLPWGIYQNTDADVKRACGDTPFYALPRFHSRPDKMSISVHFQGAGVPAVPEVMGGDHGWVKIDPLPVGRAGRQAQRTVLHLRVARDATTNAPVWATFPMILHRPMPANGHVTWIRVHREYVAGRYAWTVVFTVDLPAPAKAAPGPAVGLDLGWRSSQTKELRAAFWHDSEGAGDAVVYPPSLRERLQKANAIRGRRDENLDQMRAAVLPLLVAARANLPEDVAKNLPHMPKWRSPKRFAALLGRIGVPSAAREILRAWAARDKHLWQYETGMRSGALRHRKEIARNFAAALAKKYSHIVLEDFNLTEAAAHPDESAIKHLPNWKKGVRKRGAHQRVEVSPSELREAIVHAAERAGVTVTKVAREGTTETCHACGFRAPWANPLERDHTCEGCGRRWDRDDNAARNILGRGLWLPEAPASTPTVSKPQGALAESAKRHHTASADGVRLPRGIGPRAVRAPQRRGARKLA